MSGSLDLTNNEMPKASASPSGSSEDNPEVIAQKKAIIEMSNQSVLRGYDMAVDLLTLQGFEEAAVALIKYRGLMEIGLENSIVERYKQ